MSRSRRGWTSWRRPCDAALYRIAQESITNALRHARGASRVDVRVTGDDRFVRLRVEDDGAAAPPPGRHSDSSGYGIVGMRERATMLGGTISAGPQAGGGWKVEALLPRTGAEA